MLTRTNISRIPSLDGIRAVAISLVFLSHGGLSGLIPGGLGVTLFFALSGYLITTLLLKEFTATGSVDLKAFYARRFWRLVPPLVVILALALCLTEVYPPRITPTFGGVAAVIFYFSNYFSILGHAGIPDGLGITWSLSVEEHFYILFPLMAPFIMRARAVRRGLYLAAGCTAILGWRFWLATHGADSERIYGATDTRLDSILIGCALALLCNPTLYLTPVPSRQATWGMAVGALFLLAATLIYRNVFFRDTLRYTVQSILIAPLIYLAVVRSRLSLFRWLNTPPVAYVGKISYTIYLSHQICLVAVNDQFPAWGTARTLWLAGLLTLTISALMRRFVELPLARLLRYFSNDNTTARTDDRRRIGTETNPGDKAEDGLVPPPAASITG